MSAARLEQLIPAYSLDAVIVLIPLFFPCLFLGVVRIVHINKTACNDHKDEQQEYKW